MRVLLISPNRERVPDPVFPLGLAYVAAALLREGHRVDVLDLCFEEEPESRISEKVTSFKPDIIGLSLRNIDDVSYPRSVSYLAQYREVVGLLRKHSRSLIVLGGAGLTIMAEDFVRELGADYAIAGEGEEAFPQFVRNWQRGELPTHTVVRARPIPAHQIGLTSPARELFDCGRYYGEGGMLSIQTKRGCPFGCIYCSYPAIEGKRSRLRNPADVAEEIATISQSTGAKHFFFVDSIFNYPAEHAERVSEEISARDLAVRWTCYGNPAFLTARLAEQMRKAGCTSVEFGSDAMVDDSLRAMRKGFSYDQIVEATRICRGAGMKTCHFMFVGAPGDTLDRVKLNLERLAALEADASVIMVGIRILPGTALARLAKKEFGIRAPSLDPVYYIAPGIARDTDRVVEYIGRNYPRWIVPGFEINVNERLQSFLRRAGIRGALWEEITNR
ncbi:MAG: lipid biosynthesis B12-binding/radical SAM protein [Thermodesulfovibrionales bacterium]